MSLETSRLRITGVTGGPLRITGASLVNGAYELATAGGADYELQTERQTTMENILFIPGIANPVSEINQLLFGQGQQGTFIAPSLTASLISGSTFGTGVETLPDLSPRNNPFSQANSGNRAAWFREPKTGRRQLLLQTEALTTTPWFTSGSEATQGTGIAPVITPGQLAPDGSLTAWRVQLNCGGGTTSNDRSGVAQSLTGLPLSVTSTQVYIKPLDGTTGSQLANTFTSISIIAAGSNPLVNNTATAQPDGWFLLTRNVTPTNSNGSYRIQLLGNQQQTLDILVWHPQAEVGATPTNYQRVTTAFDVTESGQRDCYGVRADGIDDFYTTASTNFTGTDKVTVFAAVRKLSDAAVGVIAELTSNLNTVNGSFFVAAPGSITIASGQNASFNARGTSIGAAVTATGLISPVTVIATGEADISASTVRLRSNGVLIGTTTTSLGSGSFANDILYLFRRGGTTLPFNGNLYALIVAGGSYPLSTIQRVERILSRITPTVNL
jgi:hypothetical protein